MNLDIHKTNAPQQLSEYEHTTTAYSSNSFKWDSKNRKITDERN
jgi:hypothetical protein